MNIVMLAAGAGGMVCGSCLRDNTLAAGMMRAGGKADIRLIPLYTPLKTDELDVSTDGVFYGGLNVYLQQTQRFFRHTPRTVDWLLDRRPLLRAAGCFVGSTPPERLGELTVSILRGGAGRQRKELRRLVKHLAAAAGPAPDAVILPNAMFLGTAHMLRKRLRTTVLCQLTGEDVFLDGLAEPHRREAWRLIRQAAGHVDRFIATSRWYAEMMAEALQVDREKIDVVLPGVSGEGLAPADAPDADRPPTIAYMARICPEKGLDLLIQALVDLRKRPGLEETHLVAGGYLARKGPDRVWFKALQAKTADTLRPEAFQYVGEVDRAGKQRLLAGADVLCVPTAHPDAKGLFVLEGWVCGLPFVGFDHGALPELLDAAATDGQTAGLLAPPSKPAALADALAKLLKDPARRRAMGQTGRRAVAETLSADRMAAGVFQSVRKALNGR